MFNLVPFNKRNDLIPRDQFFNQIFDQFFKEDFFAPFNTAGNSFHVDLTETNESYVVKADLPGIKKDDITINFENDYLTISAQRDDEAEVKESNYLRRERRYGQFSRSFYVRNVREENIDAEFSDGVLSVTLPKKENTASGNKTITIR
ncbi:18 kDa heat shock protein [Sporomusa ovata DSM 2662]|uniref:Small heat shock protein n=1 Tax=Sporomusa ovata TaxID=2378 RepID=A0A0U1L2A1_9FIRM|nr:heat shock protein Hsp18 [Sporomusa ovata]EQB25239.1 18 kDa heat shock protein [Sporomusa ovata DSM 2662]CQR73802.1 Small heat shock protein [Sporomusa ovata]